MIQIFTTGSKVTAFSNTRPVASAPSGDRGVIGLAAMGNDGLQLSYELGIRLIKELALEGNKADK